jgi:Tol biopolymer transport system component
MRRLTTAPAGSMGDRNPAFSPDGRRLAFGGSRGDGLGVYLLALADDLSPAGEPELLMEQIGMRRGLAWGWSESELLVVSENKLWVVDIENPEARRPLPFPGSTVDFPAVSGRASRLAYQETSAAINIWEVPLAGGAAQGPPAKLISSTGYDNNFQISPDGARIVYRSFRPTEAGIWLADADGTHHARLGDKNGGTPRWSPDSKTVVFDCRSEGSDYDIWTIPADGGIAVPFTKGDADDRSPSWSRDGDWIYFASDRGAGSQLLKKHVHTGREIQVTRHGGFYSEESVDGRFVYYTKGRQDWTVWRAPVDGGDEIQVLESVSTWNNFAVAKDGVYYTPRRGPNGLSPIRFYDFASESVTEVYAPDKPTSNGISVSTDGRRLLYAQIDHGGGDLMLVENFR